MVRPLVEAELRAALAQLPGWRCEEGALLRDLRFPSFRSAMNFLIDASEEAERLDHHPEWCNAGNLVRIRLCTHDAGDRITTRDIGLAKVLDWVALRFLETTHLVDPGGTLRCDDGSISTPDY